jgi:serine/threonine protein phosphatase PrpC
MDIRPGLDLAQLSDVGMVRERNEDAYGYWESDNEDEFREKGRLAVVADGMGGHEGGQLASDIAVRTVCEVYREAASLEPPEALEKGLREAHERIRSFASENPQYHNMGTTCTAAVIRGTHLWVAHVGDSRLYLFRNGRIRRMTRDHSYVNQLVEHGIITNAEAEHHPQRNVLTSALGIGRDGASIDVSAEPTQLEPGNTLLLCTDGLWGLVNELELFDAVTENSPTDACRLLVNMAKERGGPDNITVEILRFVSFTPSSNHDGHD